MNNLTIRESFAPQTLDEAIKFSEMISKSFMVPKDYQGKPANCLVAIQWGMELGLSPMAALQNISVINGKPAVWGDALLAMVRADSRCLSVKEEITGEGDNRVASCSVRRQHSGEVEEIIRTFSVAQAKTANLWNKRGPWQDYPERMLQHRARGNALRDAFPDVLHGMMSSEEAQDIPIKDVTPKVGVTPPKLEEITVNREPPKPDPSPPLYSNRMPYKQTDETVIKTEQEKSEFRAMLSEISETVKPKKFILFVPNKPAQYFESEQDYMDAYNNILLAVRRADSIAHATRRTKMKELEKVNLDTFEKLDPAHAIELCDKRKAYNASLSIESKEVEENE